MNLKALRKARNYSQEQLATLSGLNVRTIQRLEKGTTPSEESLKCLAAALGVEVSQIIDTSELKKKSDERKAITLSFLLIAFAAIFILFAAKSETLDAATGAFFYLLAAGCFLVASFKMYKSGIGTSF